MHACTHWQVDEADYGMEVCKLREVASTFVKTNSDVVRLMLRPPLLICPGKLYMLSALIKVGCP